MDRQLIILRFHQN